MVFPRNMYKATANPIRILLSKFTFVKKKKEKKKIRQPDFFPFSSLSLAHFKHNKTKEISNKIAYQMHSIFLRHKLHLRCNRRKFEKKKKLKKQNKHKHTSHHEFGFFCTIYSKIAFDCPAKKYHSLEC